MTGMVHANDVAYDAYLANDRTLADPQVIPAEAGMPLRLRIINGATATGFWISTGELAATVAAVDGNPVQPLTARAFPLAQGQRIDLIVTPAARRWRLPDPRPCRGRAGADRGYPGQSRCHRRPPARHGRD